MKKNQSPKVSRLRLTPRTSDPVGPSEGDMQYADGTARDEGLWVYQDGAWSQVSTGAAITVLPTLTLTPASADPGSPAEGMFHVSDGTARAEGLWQYMDGDWVQITGLKYEEFTRKEPIECRVASTANVTLASAVENGDTLDGVVLATNDVILLKNQTTATENGIYTVNVSGPPTRHTSADTFTELNGAIAYVGFGTTNVNTFYYQTATLASLATNQVWSSTPAADSFTVPAGVYELTVDAAGGGGGGGAGKRNSSSGATAAGGGGGGAPPVTFKHKVAPGDVLSVSVGVGGLPARNLHALFAAGTANGGDGGSTVITFTDRTLTLYGASGGVGALEDGGTGFDAGGLGGSGYSSDIAGTYLAAEGGDGGKSSSTIVSPTAGQSSVWAAGGAITASTSGNPKGGPGGAGRGAGAAGSAATNASSVCAAAATSAGGAGGTPTTSNKSTRSGWGGSGYVRISW
jgi:hypothetical protein